MRLEAPIERLADLIRRLESEANAAKGKAVRTYGIRTDFVSFSDEKFGDLLITNDDAKEYRQCVSAIYKHAIGKSDQVSRSAVESFIQMAMLESIDPVGQTDEKDFNRRLMSALTGLKKNLKAKPVEWEVHFQADLLADKLPYAFGRCEFHFGDPHFLRGVFQRMDRAIGSHVGDKTSQEARRMMREEIQATIGGKTGVSVVVDAVDATAAQLIAKRLVHQTIDILNFFANLGGQAPSRILFPEDARPTVVKTFVFATALPSRHLSSETVGPIAPFSFASPHLYEAGMKRMSAILKKEMQSKFEGRFVSAFQWAGKASVETQREEAFLLFTIALESLLTENNEKSEITETLALRVSHLISGPKTRLLVYRDVKRLYGVRSKVVHAGSIDVGEDQLSEIRYYASLALLTLLCSANLANISTGDELADWFRSRILNISEVPKS